MSDLIPTLTITEFRQLIKDVDKLKQMKSCEVNFDGEYLFTFVNPQTDYIRVQAEYLAQTGNSIGGKDIKEIKELATV